MLSRTADHLFWMSRYTERAENTARMLSVSYETSLLPQAAEAAREGWEGLLSISELIPAFTAKYDEITPANVLDFMVRDGYNPSSIVSCLRAARENARAVRGALTTEYLLGQASAPAYLDRIMRDATEYAGFNLLVGDAQQLWHFNSQEGQPRQLESGICGLSNASLDTPWPKLLYAREALRERIEGVDEDLLELLSDNRQPADHLLPDTGVGLATERLLSSVFIASATYGTRASTVLNLEQSGDWNITERSFGPHSTVLDEVALRR